MRLRDWKLMNIFGAVLALSAILYVCFWIWAKMGEVSASIDKRIAEEKHVHKYLPNSDVRVIPDSANGVICYTSEYRISCVKTKENK